MSHTQKIDCVIYSHVWAARHIESIYAQGSEKLVLVEAAKLSNMAAMLGCQGQMDAGVAGLLEPGTRLEDLAQRYDRLAFPLVLAPRPSVPVTALNSALSVLADVPGDYERIVIMLHVADAIEILPALTHVDRFSFLLDCADNVDAKLARVAQEMANLGLIRESTWAGVFFYQRSEQPNASAIARESSLREILNSYPSLTPTVAA